MLSWYLACFAWLKFYAQLPTLGKTVVEIHAYNLTTQEVYRTITI